MSCFDLVLKCLTDCMKNIFGRRLDLVLDETPNLKEKKVRLVTA